MTSPREQLRGLDLEAGGDIGSIMNRLRELRGQLQAAEEADDLRAQVAAKQRELAATEQELQAVSTRRRQRAERLQQIDGRLSELQTSR